MVENDLFKLMMDYVSKSFKPPLDAEGNEAMCLQYGHNDLQKYLNGQMTGFDKKAFEQHAEHCDLCLYGLVTIKEEKENERLTDAALNYIKKHKQSLFFANVLQAVAVWKGKLAWFADITGTAILQREMARTTRSAGPTVKAGRHKSNKLLKVFDDEGISVEIEIGTTDDGTKFKLSFSFFDIHSEKFMEGLSVQLVNGETKKRATDQDGRVLFLLNHKGTYDVFVTKNKEEGILHFNLELSGKD